MFRSTRFVASLAILGGLSLTGVIAWLTGAIQAGWDLVAGWFHSIVDFLSQPWGLAQLALELGFPLGVIAMIVLALAFIFDS